MRTCRASSTLRAGSSTGTSNKGEESDRADRRERTDHVRRAGATRKPKRTRPSPAGVRAEERVLSCWATPSTSSGSGTPRRRSARSRPRRTRFSSRRTTLPPSTRAPVSSPSIARPSRRSARQPRAPCWLREVLVVDDEYHARLRDVPDQLEAVRTTKDDIAIWKFTTGSTGQPAAVHPGPQRGAQLRVVREGRLDLAPRMSSSPSRSSSSATRATSRRCFLLAVGAAGIVFPERSTPEKIFELDRRAPADGPRQRSDDDGADGRPP